MGVTAGNWVVIDGPTGNQPIAAVDTVQNHPFGTIVRARDIGSTNYGEGEFIYVKGVSSGAVKKWATYNSKTGATALPVATDVGPVGVFVSALDATTKFGWLQIRGRAIGACLTQFADNGRVYLTATPGSVDDASVAGDAVFCAIGRNGATVTVGDLAGEFEINRPFVESRVAPVG